MILCWQILKDLQLLLVQEVRESATYSADVTEVNIKSIMSLDDTGNLNIFPAGAANKTGISVKSGTTASPQFVGEAFTTWM